MSGPTLGNPKNTIEILQKYNFSFQKKFGQNFLIDTHVLDKIIKAANITKDDLVLEIGPGIGTMTQYLAEAAGKVIAVEIDKNLIPILADTLGEYENVQVINEDVLKLDIRALAERENGGRPIKIVANLPYYITTPIIMGLFEGMSDGEYHSDGAKRSSRPDAERTREQRLRRVIAGGSVLCKPLYCSKCSAQLFHAPAQSGLCCYSAEKA